MLARVGLGVRHVHEGRALLVRVRVRVTVRVRVRVTVRVRVRVRVTVRVRVRVRVTLTLTQVVERPQLALSSGALGTVTLRRHAEVRHQGCPRGATHQAHALHLVRARLAVRAPATVGGGGAATVGDGGCNRG